MTDPRPLLARLGNALSRRYATPVETHPVPHVGCYGCELDARAWLRGVVEEKARADAEAALRTIRLAPSEMARVVALRDRYQGARS